MIDISTILLFVLGVMAIIDIIIKKIPSIFLTGLIFLVGMIGLIGNNVFHLALGVMAFVYAWLLYEGDFIGGLADVKFLTIIGLMVRSLNSFFAFVLITLFVGLAYKIILVYILKQNQKEEVAFIPALYYVYVILYLIGGF